MAGAASIATQQLLLVLQSLRLMPSHWPHDVLLPTCCKLAQSLLQMLGAGTDARQQT